MARRLLVISFNFPPSGEVAGKVVARQLRHLSGHGWEPVVVAPPPEASLQLDREGYADVEQIVRVERTAPVTSAFEAVVRLSLLKNRIFGGPSTRAELALAAPEYQQKELSWARKLKSVARELCTFPDNCSGWIKPAKRTALRLMKSERFDAIMSISPSVSAHLAALKVHRRYPMVPWIANFHDPWCRNDLQGPAIPALKRWERHLERTVVAESQLVVCATDELRDTFAADHPAQTNFLTLSNGFDPGDLPMALPQRAADGRMVLTYAGTLYSSRDPSGLFRALSNLIASRRLRRERVLVRFIGDCERVGLRSMRAIIAEFGLDGVVELVPPVSYPQALSYLAQSDILLLFAEEQPMQIPAKAFEYLFLGRRILAICDGATARLISPYSCARVVTSRDLPSIEGALARWSSEIEHRVRAAAVPVEELAHLRADALTGRFAVALNRLVGASQEPPLPTDGRLIESASCR